MRVDLGDGAQLLVRFEYRRWGEMRCTGDMAAARKQPGEPLVTRCVLSHVRDGQVDSEIATGESVCHAADHFDYRRGRRLALTRALRDAYPSAHDLEDTARHRSTLDLRTTPVVHLPPETYRRHQEARTLVWQAYNRTTRDLRPTRGAYRQAVALLRRAQAEALALHDDAELALHAREAGALAMCLRIDAVIDDLAACREAGLL